MLTALLLAAMLQVDVEAPSSPPANSKQIVRTYNSHGWLVRETSHFRVMTVAGMAVDADLPQKCEALRSCLQETWFGKTEMGWTPKCDIVVHPTVTSYARFLGPGSEQSSGCATLTLKNGQVTRRRVDLRADARDWLTSSLPHELTHVVIADRFPHQQLPRWADEGISILAESEAKQERRLRALASSLADNRRIETRALLNARQYPHASLRDAFYGQSASLVGYLMERDSPAKFLDFVEMSMTKGTDAALREVYQIPSVAHLDSAWHPRLREREKTPVLLTESLAQITTGTGPGGFENVE